ncbi:MAG: 30S ribosomal protein S6e [Candidatus Diapherotrites archaeon]|nr:30S ribosomal protein S6e [Candidatus Diapherotrites archaeon]
MKLTIANPKTGKTYQKEIEKTQERQFYGKKIGSSVSLSEIGLSGYECAITGGSDKQGFPMLKSVQGTARKKVLLTKGTGLKDAKLKGVRIKKSVRGGLVSEEIEQLNLKVTKEGSKKIESYFGADAEKAEEKKEEASAKVEEKKPKVSEPKKKEEEPKEKEVEEKPKEKEEEKNE